MQVTPMALDSAATDSSRTPAPSTPERSIRGAMRACGRKACHQWRQTISPAPPELPGSEGPKCPAPRETRTHDRDHHDRGRDQRRMGPRPPGCIQNAVSPLQHGRQRRRLGSYLFAHDGRAHQQALALDSQFDAPCTHGRSLSLSRSSSSRLAPHNREPCTSRARAAAKATAPSVRKTVANTASASNR